MWSDNESRIDLLDFSHLVRAMRTIVDDEALLPATIGVFGDWGGGKSSLLWMLKAELAAQEDTLCLDFNGWLFEGYVDAKTALLGTIVDEIMEKRSLGTKVSDAAGRLLKRLDLLKIAGLAVKGGVAYATGGLSAVGWTVGAGLLANLKKLVEKGGDIPVEEVTGLLKKAEPDDAEVRRTVREFRKDFQDLLEESGLKRLVVVIDDLDRCTPDTIIETLEAIKLFLFVPKTVFLIGADERLVKYAVRRRFPELPGETAEVGRDYLEKLVQFPIRVPPLGPAELETYINLLFVYASSLSAEDKEAARVRSCRVQAEKIHEVGFNSRVAGEVFKSMPPDLGEALTLAGRLAPVLTIGLNGNPRQCKRFLNALLLRIDMAKSRNVELKRSVLAKLMLLEYFRPQFFQELANLQAQEEGRPAALRRCEDAAGPVEANSEPEKAQFASAENAASTKRSPTALRETPVPTAATEPDAWTGDSWMLAWFESPPALRGEDLRPYFFFSRDSIGPLGVAPQRLTPAAQEVLNRLVSESKAASEVGLKHAEKLNPAEAAAVFESLCQKAHRSESAGDRERLITTMLNLCGVKPDLFGQGVAFLARVPESSVPMATPVQLLRVAREIKRENIPAEVLQRWTRSANKRLAAATKRVLEKIK